MHRSQRWLQVSIATLVFALAAFAQNEHAPNRPSLSVQADQRRRAMSVSVSILLTRNLYDVFGENDAARQGRTQCCRQPPKNEDNENESRS